MSVIYRAFLLDLRREINSLLFRGGPCGVVKAAFYKDWAKLYEVSCCVGTTRLASQNRKNRGFEMGAAEIVREYRLNRHNRPAEYLSFVRSKKH